MIFKRKWIKDFVCKQRFLRKPSSVYCANNSLLPEVFVKTAPESLKRIFGLPAFDQGSQLNQDIFALVFNRFKKGYFLEIGANDGFKLSNTVYLETCFGWDGLLVEPNPRYAEALKLRKAKVCQDAVGEKIGMVNFVDAGLFGGIKSSLCDLHPNETNGAPLISVKTRPLKDILSDFDVPSVINFCSIDVEGGELPIVEQLCKLSTHRVMSGCVEHNFRHSEARKMAELLEKSGYQIVWKDQTNHDLFFVDASQYDI